MKMYQTIVSPLAIALVFSCVQVSAQTVGSENKDMLRNNARAHDRKTFDDVQYDSNHKSASHYIRLLVTAVSRGDTLLMNIGPKGDGSFDTKDLTVLKGIDKWMDHNNESVNAGKSLLPLQSWGESTMKDTKLYLHVFHWPADGKLYVGGIKSTPDKTYLLSNPKIQLNLKRINTKDLLISVPRNTPDTMNTVIVLEFSNKIETDPVRYLSSNISMTRLLAIDATQHGAGFIYGDDKTNRYLVQGWNNKDQSLSWTVRTTEDSRYRIMIKYLTSENSGGDYALKVDDAYEFGYTVNSEKNNNPIEQELAELTITAGTHTISLQPKNIKKAELMKLLELQLIPIED